MNTETPTIGTNRRRRGTLRQVSAALGIALVALSIFAAAIGFAYARMNDGRILGGVSVGGFSVAGLTPEEALENLRGWLPDARTGALTLNVGPVEEVVPYAEIGRDYDVAASVQEAMSVGRRGNLLDQVLEQLSALTGGVNIAAPAVSYDAQALAARVEKVVAAAELDPVDASVTANNGQYIVTPASNGRAVDEDALLAQATAALENNPPGDTSVTIAAVTVPPQIETAVAEDAVAQADAVASTPLAVRARETTRTIPPETLRGWIALTPAGVDGWSLVIAREPIQALVSELQAAVDQPVIEARFSFERGRAIARPGQTGYELDEAGALEMVLAELEARSTVPPTPLVELPVATTVPETTTEEAESLVEQVRRLGAWTTRYVPSKANSNGQNIRRPANLIDGYVVEPGAVFDFVKVAGPITEANGYGDGAAIVRGKTRGEGVLGGGLCSASTTMFNAALRAGFEIGERRNHAYYITRYPVGLDATIWISGGYTQTMTFTNDSPYPILIRGINRERSVTFQVWGVPDGRTVRLSDPETSRVKQAGNFYEYTDLLPAGVMERKEYPADGFFSVVTRTVRDAEGNVLHENTFRSNYRKVDGLVLVGRAPGDPRAGTRIPFSEGLPNSSDASTDA